MRTKYLGVLVAVMLVVGACGAASQPSTDPVDRRPGRQSVPLARPTSRRPRPSPPPGRS